jgi:hypothetical protein
MNPIDELRRVHSAIWRECQGVSEATKAAGEITRQWQSAVTSQNERYKAEFPVCGLGEKIDLVDTESKIAYELKVSANNTHMEFYRDVFKVLAHNESAVKDERLKKLIFLAPEAGAVRLQRGLGEAACRIAEKFGFTVEVQAL